MSTYFALLIGLVSSYIFIFVTWRSLREDFSDRLVFSSVFKVLLGIYLGAIVSFLLKGTLTETAHFNPAFLPSVGVFVGGTIAIFLVARTLKLNIVRFLEIAGPGLLWATLAMNLLFNPVLSLVSAVCLLAFYIMRAKYKRIHWYKSGKVGFAVCFSFGIFFLLRAVIAIVAPTMIFSVGRVETVFGLALAFLCFFEIYQLSQ